MKPFYNTIKLGKSKLEKEISNAKNQEEKILKIFNKKKELTPSEVWEYLMEYPLTSIRRAMTNLTDQGRLIKTSTQKIGYYGKPNYVWKLKSNE